MSSLFDNGMVTILPTSKGLGRGPTIEARQDLHSTRRGPVVHHITIGGADDSKGTRGTNNLTLSLASADNVTLGDLLSADADHCLAFLSFSILCLKTNTHLPKSQETKRTFAKFFSLSFGPQTTDIVVKPTRRCLSNVHLR